MEASDRGIAVTKGYVDLPKADSEEMLWRNAFADLQKQILELKKEIEDLQKLLANHEDLPCSDAHAPEMSEEERKHEAEIEDYATEIQHEEEMRKLKDDAKILGPQKAVSNEEAETE